MTIDANKNLLLDLNFRTEILESVDWDEYSATLLIEDLQFLLSKDSGTPEDIIEYIREKYTDRAGLIIANMFKQEYIIHGLYQADDEEN